MNKKYEEESMQAAKRINNNFSTMSKALDSMSNRLNESTKALDKTKAMKNKRIY